MFYFIGGGSRVKDVREFKEKHGLTNIVQLPHYPLEQLSEPLAAADLHVAVMGDPFVGIVHPCKVYGAMSVSRAVLLLGPNPCHVSDLIANHSIGWHVHHGDVKSAFQVVRMAAESEPASGSVIAIAAHLPS